VSAYLNHRLHRIAFRERYGFLDELLRNQSMSRSQLLDKQQRELHEIVRFSAIHTDYYAKKYAGIVYPERPVPPVEALPPLQKDEVLQHRDEMVVRTLELARLRVGSTGGSTGKPLAFYYDHHKMELMRAGMCRSYMWSGWRPGEKILNFWGARQDIRTDVSIRKKYLDFIAAEKTIPAYQYTESELADWAKTIVSYRPVLLQGYASILAELARYIVDQDIAVPETIKGVYSTAEVLYGWQRQLMVQAFGCKVFNQYGSREIPNMAVECQHGNQHVFTDMVYMESVGEDGESHLLVTSLTNRVMPFIRYQIGDSGALKAGECSCGSPFPMMEMGVCRSNDIIRTPTGRCIYPAYFIHLLDDLSGIRQYQFEQDLPDRIKLHVASAHQLSDDIIRELQSRVSAEVDEQMRLEVIQTDEIPRTVSGKHRFVISYAD
jgi:phenylacetate-CoA ligase